MKLFFIALSLFLSACTTIHNISNSSISSKITLQNTNLIQAEDKATSFFHLNEPSLHVMDKLKLQCRDGVIQGVETKLSSRELIFVQFYNLSAIAHCTKI